jgi:UDP-glucose 4-epimerase
MPTAGREPLVLIGGAGFIGRHLARRLAREAEVRVLDRMPGDLPEGVRYVPGGLEDRDALAAVLAPGATVVHLAWSTLPASSNRDPRADAAENIVGSLGLLEACRDARVRRVVYVSSGGTVYGRAARLPVAEDDPAHPLCAYGVSKLAVEKYVALFRHLYGLEYSILRPGNAYGPGQDPARGQSAPTVFAHRVLSGEPVVIWGDGSAVRDYLHVDDLVEAVVRVLAFQAPPAGPRLFNVGTGRGTSLTELVALCGKVLGKTPRVEYAPGRALDVPANVLDARRLGQVTGWSARVSLEDGIESLARAWEPGR